MRWEQSVAGATGRVVGWLLTASMGDWPGDDEAGAVLQRAAESVVKGILATFGVYESDIHDLDRTANELEVAYPNTGWRQAERAKFAEGIRALRAKGRKAREGGKRPDNENPVEPLTETIERLGRVWKLQVEWHEAMASLHPAKHEEMYHMTRWIHKQTVQEAAAMDDVFGKRLDTEAGGRGRKLRAFRAVIEEAGACARAAQQRLGRARDAQATGEGEAQ